jgi:hypothetical protein
MRKSKFLHIRAMLHTAEELYNSGQINDEMYLQLIEIIESDYKKIVKKLETQEFSEILTNYIIGFS